MGRPRRVQLVEKDEDEKRMVPELFSEVLETINNTPFQYGYTIKQVMNRLRLSGNLYAVEGPYRGLRLTAEVRRCLSYGINTGLLIKHGRRVHIKTDADESSIDQPSTNLDIDDNDETDGTEEPQDTKNIGETGADSVATDESIQN